MPITYDISTYGATGSALQDVTPYLDMFRVDALAYQATHPGELITLYFPPGGTYNWGTAGSETSFLRNLKNVKVIGTGATFTATLGGSFYATGWDSAHPIQQGTDVLLSARCETCLAGATNITLIDPTKASLFVVGSMHLMTGFAVYFNGYPTTHHYFEYVRIVAVTGAVLTVQEPLKFTYKKTWPCYSVGTGGSPDNGGPATLYKFDQSWDQAVEWVGASFDPTTTPMQSSCRDMTYTTCTWTGASSGALVTMTKTCTFRQGCSMPNCGQEIDKYIDTVIWDASGFHQVFIQTSAVNYMYVQNGSFSEGATSTINGTAKKMYVTGATTHVYSILLGAYGYGGISLEFHWTDAQIDAIGWGGWNTNSIGNLHAYATISNGVITWNMTDTYLSCGQVIIPSWAVPGQYFCIGGSDLQGPELMFKVLDIVGEKDGSISQDISTESNLIYITTDIPGTSWPTNLSGGSGWLTISTHACPKFCFNNGTGLAAAQFAGIPGDRPFGEYFTKVVTQNSASDIPNFVWGHLERMKLDITLAWAGDFSGLETYPFTWVLDTAGTAVEWNPRVNSSSISQNILEPSGYVLGTGSNGGIVPPWNFHFPFGSGIRPRFDPHPSGLIAEGRFTLQANQHITYVSPYYEDMAVVGPSDAGIVLLGQIVM